MFHRVTSQGRKIFEARQQADQDFLRKLLDTFQDLACRGKLKLSSLCTHSRGQGGVKRALGEVDDALRGREFTHVYRSDAMSCYASNRNDILLQQPGKLPLPAGLQKTVAAYCQRTLHYGGLYASFSRGISQEKTFDFLGMDFSHHGLCGLSAATAGRVKEVTAQVYDCTSREARQGKTKSPGQDASPLASQAEFLRRVETYRKNWQRYLKGILAGFHMHLGVAAAQALYQRLCAQHRQLTSTDPWLNHFPLPRLQGKPDETNTKTQKKYVRKIQKDELGGCCMHVAGC